MYCEKCGSYLTDGSRFCPNCGTPTMTAAPSWESDTDSYDADGYAEPPRRMRIDDDSDSERYYEEPLFNEPESAADNQYGCYDPAAYYEEPRPTRTAVYDEPSETNSLADNKWPVSAKVWSVLSFVLYGFYLLMEHGNVTFSFLILFPVPAFLCCVVFFFLPTKQKPVLAAIPLWLFSVSYLFTSFGTERFNLFQVIDTGDYYEEINEKTISQLTFYPAVLFTILPLLLFAVLFTVLALKKQRESKALPGLMILSSVAFIVLALMDSYGNSLWGFLFGFDRQFTYDDPSFCVENPYYPVSKVYYSPMRWCLAFALITMLLAFICAAFSLYPEKEYVFDDDDDYGVQTVYHKFCPNCGIYYTADKKFCDQCASPLRQMAAPVRVISENDNPMDAPSAGFAALGFFIPVVGLILYLVWKDNFPRRSRSAGKGALAGVIVSVSLSVLTIIAYLIFIGALVSML